MARGFLLTYNPVYWLWPLDERAPGRTMTWNVGTRRKGIEPGDHLFVLQQGLQGRGLLAYGVAQGNIQSVESWDLEPGKRITVVEAMWVRAEPQPFISTSELRFAAPHTYWAPRQSGAAVARADVETLVALCSN